MTTKEYINIVWFKRDLRLHDNEAVHNALNSNEKTLFLYVFEPILLNDKNYSERHFNFIKQSLEDLNKNLETFNTNILCVNGNIIEVFQKILEFYRVKCIYSHQETGVAVTYDRDKKIKRFTRNNLINWEENINNGIQRGIANRKGWTNKWYEYITKPLIKINDTNYTVLNFSDIKNLETHFELTNLETETSKLFQKGGRKTAIRYLKSFIEERHNGYMYNISKPEESRFTCSRLSPYFAWGNLSTREVYQTVYNIKKDGNKRHVNAFLSRLRWQAHFTQKFEMEFEMEYRNLNKGFDKLNKKVSEQYIEAWEKGMTGIPIVDACMRCLSQTGYLNFRMRALIVSFFTHHLWQPWQKAACHLSRVFLDFEAGIHFPQLQMQAGVTGINTIRIYSPIKNSKELDPNGLFIKKWVTEIAHIPKEHIHEPFNMTPLEQQLNKMVIGRDYPSPVVDIKKARKKASDLLWDLKKDPIVKAEGLKIVIKHNTD
jgi:deoxyribodipyrimidine photo-lyase